MNKETKENQKKKDCNLTLMPRERWAEEKKRKEIYEYKNTSYKDEPTKKRGHEKWTKKKKKERNCDLALTLRERRSVDETQAKPTNTRRRRQTTIPFGAQNEGKRRYHHVPSTYASS